MRRSNLSPRRALHGIVVTLAVAGSLVLAGCSSANMSGSAEPAPSATETVSREAGWFQKPIRVCFQNNTSRSLEYSFSDEQVNDQGESVSTRGGTLGTNAFVCAASTGARLSGDSVAFKYKNSEGKFSYLSVENDLGRFIVRLTEVDNAGSTKTYIENTAKAGVPYSDVAGGEAIDVLVGTGLRTFDKITSIPIDVRISDAP